MKVLTVHNYYQQHGGEDQIFEAESAMLEKYGCRVFNYRVHNNLIKGKNLLSITQSTIWNKATFIHLCKAIKQKKPDVIHFHNTFPLISASAYYAAKAANIPVVQTLHNYRLLCPNALFFSNGHICEDCLSRLVPWPSVFKACYRENRSATTVSAAMLLVHRILRTYRRMVDLFISLTEFARQKFVQSGFPEEKIVVKPNFIYPDPGNGTGNGRYALFVGRLSHEKGINILISAWDQILAKIPLKIVGDGPLSPVVAEALLRNDNIKWYGRQPRHIVLNLMKDASALIFPSICYEGLPMSIVEAYSVGLPVIASNIGSLSSLIDHKNTGLFFKLADPADLASKVEWIFSHSNYLRQMQRSARAEYENKYTEECNYEMLIEIYQKAIQHNKQKK